MKIGKLCSKRKFVFRKEYNETETNIPQGHQAPKKGFLSFIEIGNGINHLTKYICSLPFFPQLKKKKKKEKK